MLKSQYRVQKNSKIDLICENLTPFFRMQLERSGPNKDTITDFVYSCLEDSNIQPNTRKGYISSLSNLSLLHENKPFTEMNKDDIMTFLNSYKKPENEDPLHKWVGTWNLYVILIGKFFKWINKSECVEGIKQYRRKEKSIYKPSDLWTAEDDLLFLRYCPYKRDKCYHMISRDLSCRPHEILKLRIKDVVFRTVGGRQFAEVLVNGKTGSRSIPLINSLPYLKDWLDNHPQSGNPDAFLICSIDKRLARRIGISAVGKIYDRSKKMFEGLLKDDNVPKKDRASIKALLNKPWNPYIRRHSALTDKSRQLKEHVLRQHAGWSVRSNMPEKYLHYFGNESSESILEAFGIKPREEETDRMKPRQCPNCNELNQVNAKFCVKCRMILSLEAYTETVEGRDSLELKMKALEESNKEILECLKHPEKLVKIADSD